MTIELMFPADAAAERLLAMLDGCDPDSHGGTGRPVRSHSLSR